MSVVAIEIRAAASLTLLIAVPIELVPRSGILLPIVTAVNLTLKKSQLIAVVSSEAPPSAGTPISDFGILVVPIPDAPEIAIEPATSCRH